ncbi:membrane protein [Microlunatus endophyticus]|uniref:Membrane protein n=1 Tax=Microlunatus endophyticus TaxID=1716077 RepID=A0A917S3H3_9ACTN|nr:hypothetical protein [Microlunatus endophyticus]GGL51830.1 membrane protein [Microlunatus endophyticus]
MTTEVAAPSADSRAGSSVGVRVADRQQAVRTTGRWRLLRPVLIFHLVARALNVAGLLVASAISGRSFSDVVTRWDGQWYYKVAVLGYQSPLPTRPDGSYQSSTAAFFPLYPLLVNGLRSVGLLYWQAALVINLVAATAAVLIIVLVGLQYLDRRSAQLLGCLWTAFPVSVVLNTTYTEAVFTAFAAAALLFALRRQWLLAGLLAALAGAVRSPGIVVAGAVALAGLEAIVRRREWRGLIAVLLAPLGFLASIGYIGLRTGTLDAWRLTERDGWHTTLSYGADWVDYLRQSPATVHGRLHLILAIFAVGLMASAIVAIALRPPLPIIGLIAAGTVMAFAYGGVVTNAAPRVMMSFFPALAPIAILMVRWPAVVRWLLLGLGAVVAAVIGGYYFAFSPIPV